MCSVNVFKYLGFSLCRYGSIGGRYERKSSAGKESSRIIRGYDKRQYSEHGSKSVIWETIIMQLRPGNGTKAQGLGTKWWKLVI